MSFISDIIEKVSVMLFPTGRAFRIKSGYTTSQIVAGQTGAWTLQTSALNKNLHCVAYGNGLFVVGALTGEIMTSPDGVVWTARTSVISESLGAAYGNGIFVTVGGNSGNAIASSPDGITWTLRTTPANLGFYAVCFGNGLFVAVGGNFAGTQSAIVTSPDGITWTLQTTPLSFPMWNIAFGNGVFVVIENQSRNQYLTSIDGITWTLRTPIILAHNWSGIAFGNGIFIQTGLSEIALTSPDGINWTAHSIPSGYWYAIAFGNGLFVAVTPGYGLSVTSTDGIIWTQTILAGAWGSIGFGNNLFVAAGFTGYPNNIVTLLTSPSTTVVSITDRSNFYKLIAGLAQSESRAYNDAVSILNSILPDNNNFTTDDATDWERRLGLITNQAVSLEDRKAAIIRKMNHPGTIKARQYYLYVQGQLQAAGFNVYVYENIFESLSPWLTNPTGTVNNSWYSVCFGNGLFVAVATSGIGNRVMTSSNGLAWTSRTSAADNTWRSVCFGNSLFVAVSLDGANRVMTSPDGITWTSRTAASASTWIGVCFGNGLFVAVGSNVVMTSPDGITWTSRTASAAKSWYSVCFGNSLFVAVAIDNAIMTSPDGVTWTSRTTPVFALWSSVCFGNSLFVAVALSNAIMISTDGITWTNSVSPISIFLTSIIYGNGIFVAVDQGSNNVIISQDGINWTGEAAAAANIWNSICFGNDLFVAVSQNGYPNNVMISSGFNLITKSPNQVSGVALNKFQFGQRQFGQFQWGGGFFPKVVNSIDQDGDSVFNVGSNSRSTFFIGGSPIGTYANVDAEREREFRQLILKLKPTQEVAYLFINFV